MRTSLLRPIRFLRVPSDLGDQRQDDFKEPYAVEPNEVLEVNAALDNFNLDALKRYFGLWKHKRISEQKQIKQRGRNSE